MQTSCMYPFTLLKLMKIERQYALLMTDPIFDYEQNLLKLQQQFLVPRHSDEDGKRHWNNLTQW